MKPRSSSRVTNECSLADLPHVERSPDKATTREMTMARLDGVQKASGRGCSGCCNLWMLRINGCCGSIDAVDPRATGVGTLPQSEAANGIDSSHTVANHTLASQSAILSVYPCLGPSLSPGGRRVDGSARAAVVTGHWRQPAHRCQLGRAKSSSSPLPTFTRSLIFCLLIHPFFTPPPLPPPSSPSSPSSPPSSPLHYVYNLSQ